jgi:hypothetical protein
MAAKRSSAPSRPALSSLPRLGCTVSGPPSPQTLGWQEMDKKGAEPHGAEKTIFPASQLLHIEQLTIYNCDIRDAGAADIAECLKNKSLPPPPGTNRSSGARWLTRVRVGGSWSRSARSPRTTLGGRGPTASDSPSRCPPLALPGWRTSRGEVCTPGWGGGLGQREGEGAGGRASTVPCLAALPAPLPPPPRLTSCSKISTSTATPSGMRASQP